ncbi:hypothetical protein H6775_01550 [Candidatus Nomurabacteria bacterium]|nr:hypothetical protein [Candidatus Nomurabacteria bacterium]
MSESLEGVKEITKEDLKRLLDKLNGDKDSLLEDPPGNSLLEKEVDKKVLELIEKLLEQKGFFQKVYRTSNGSLYFVLIDGTSLRFKFIEEKNDIKKYQPQSLMDEHVFISREQYELLREDGLQDELDDNGFVEGSIPFEVGRKQYDKRAITFDGLGKVRVDWSNIDRYHFGHSVTEILKS